MHQIVLEPDNYPSVTDEPLSLIEQEVLTHWRRFQPTLVRNLEKQGPTALETAVRAAWWRREHQIGVMLSNNPSLHRLQAEEMCRGELWLPPEPGLIPEHARATTH